MCVVYAPTPKQNGCPTIVYKPSSLLDVNSGVCRACIHELQCNIKIERTYIHPVHTSTPPQMDGRIYIVYIPNHDKKEV